MRFLHPKLQLLRGSTAKEAGSVLASSVVSSFLSFITVLLIARGLPTREFGLYSFFFTTTTLLFSVSDLGLSTSMLRFYLRRDAQADQQRSAILGRFLAFKLVTATGSSLLVLLVVPLIYRHIFRGDLYFAPLCYAAVGAWFGGLMMYSQSVLQARQMFMNYASCLVGGSIVKCTAVVLLWKFGEMQLPFLYMAIIVSSAFTFVIGISYVVSELRPRPTAARPMRFSEVYDFTRWIAISGVVGPIYGYAPIFLLGILEGPEGIAVYSAGVFLAQGLNLLSNAIMTVFLPRALRCHNQLLQIKYLVSYLRGSSLFASCFLPCLVFAKPLVLLTLGSQYKQSVPIFQLMGIYFLLQLICNPVQFLLYTRGKPHVMTGVDVSSLVAFILVGVLLIPAYGAVGAAVGQLLVHILARLFTLAYIVKDLFFPSIAIPTTSLSPDSESI